MYEATSDNCLTHSMFFNDATIVVQGWRYGQYFYFSIGSATCSSAKTHPVSVIMAILEIKINVFTCLPGTEECDIFPNLLDLALVSNKTNEGVKKQWDGHRVEVRVLTAA